MKVLSVAEKPSVAKEIANILSRGQYATKDGASRYNRIFEFQRHHEQRPCTMLVTSVIGHLKEMDFPENYGASWRFMRREASAAPRASSWLAPLAAGAVTCNRVPLEEWPLLCTHTRAATPTACISLPVPVHRRRT